MIRTVWSIVLSISLLASQVSSLGEAIPSTRFSHSVLEAARPVFSKGVHTTEVSGFSQRPGQSFTLMPSGEWLVLGGEDALGPIDEAWVIEPNRRTARRLPNGLLRARAWHTATVLPDGTILIVGGVNGSGRVEAMVEQFRPETLAFDLVTSTGLTPRARHTATLLTDGRVLMTGGMGEGNDVLDSSELFDFRSGRKVQTDAFLHGARQTHIARLSADGSVSISGGVDAFGRPASYEERFDPFRSIFQIRTSEPPVASPAVQGSIPADGDLDISLNAVPSLRFSRPLDVGSANIDTVQIIGPAGAVDGKVVPAEGGMLVFVRPVRDLAPGSNYALTVHGVRDTSGVAIPDAYIRFSTAGADSDAGSASANSTNRPPEVEELPPLRGRAGATALAGRTLMLDGKPLAGVTFRIDGVTTQSDGTGRFLLDGVPAGRHELIIDGRTAHRSKETYGVFEVAVNLIAGQTVVLDYTVWMTRIDTANAVHIPFPTAQEVVVTSPLLPGLEFRIPPTAIIRDIDGNAASEISITPIPIRQPPFPLPDGVAVPLYFTIQPGGGYIELGPGIAMRGARLIYPNTFGEPAGSTFDFWNYDAGGKGWYIYGQGTVSSDRKSIVPEPGVEIYELTGAMVANGSLGPTLGPCPNCAKKAGDPVDPGTGLFVYEKTDLAVSDVIPLVLTRTYRQNDSRSRAFGIGTTHNYDIFLTGTNSGYTYQELVLPDGARVRFDRTTVGTSWTNAEYQNTSNPDVLYGATIVWNGNGWTLTAKDGTLLLFPESSGVGSPQQAGLLSIRDRNGNTVTLTRDSSSKLTRASSPNGRFIQFTYDSNNRIIQVQDNVGRTVRYEYDATGRLARVTDANIGLWQYAYDGSNRMTSITDARNIVYLRNEYDANGRVVRQTQADDTTYEFAYTTDANGRIIQTDVTDPRGHVRRLAFDPALISPSGFISGSYASSDTFGYGAPNQSTITTVRQPGTNLPTRVIDSLGRTTSFTYDALGNLTSITRLAGTPDALTTAFTYEATYSNVTSVTDAMGRTTRFTYDSKGNLISVVDPAGNISRFSYNYAGQLETATDPGGNMTQFAYDGGDLAAVTDPLGRTSTQLVDSVGRVLATIDPLGARTAREYNALSQITRLTDPLGNVASFTYDPNGNLISVTDANNNTTRFSYDNMDRVATRTDALQAVTSVDYDAVGNIVRFTDRRNTVTIVDYDELDRISFIGYGAQPGPAYESTVSPVYDQASRLRQLVDSASGTITFNYDDWDRVVSESSPQGAVSYSYDSAGRRSSMTVAGQPSVTYSYDAADRLIAVNQGGSSVDFTYDGAGRRATSTLPNGVITKYGYDAASQLVRLTYETTATKLGDLIYSYDLAGHRTTATGSFAATGIPDALDLATYNANNQIIERGGIEFSYDGNGNLTNDGSRTYVWNPRNQLTSITGSTTANFEYDALGRRTRRSVAGGATSYLYDGANIVQELSGTTPVANRLNASLDETLTRTDAAGAAQYLADGLGSTLALTDAAGAVQTQYSYEPFGRTTASGTPASNPQQFTGRENDGTGLYYYRARYYSPALARFISEDPLGFDGGDSNLYSYVSDDPVNNADPSGEVAPWVAACLWGAAFDSAMQAGANALAGRKGLSVFSGLAGAAGRGCLTGLTGFGIGQALGWAWRGAVAEQTTALSTYRVTQEGESFVRYESGDAAFSRVTRGRGLQPGTYAAPASEGILPQSALNGQYNLPVPEIARTNAFEIRPPAGTLIIGPRPVIGGIGNEVLFPLGVPTGSVGPVIPVPVN